MWRSICVRIRYDHSPPLGACARYVVKHSALKSGLVDAQGATPHASLTAWCVAANQYHGWASVLTPIGGSPARRWREVCSDLFQLAVGDEHLSNRGVDRLSYSVVILLSFPCKPARDRIKAAIGVNPSFSQSSAQAGMSSAGVYTPRAQQHIRYSAPFRGGAVIWISLAKHPVT